MDADYDSASSDGSDFHSAFDPYPSSRGMMGRSDRLPVSQDTSWIGARVSPIAFDEDDEEKLAPYKQVLSNSSMNERSALLRNINRGDRFKIHPMWDDGNPLLVQTTDADNRTQRFFHWGNVVVAISGSHLFAIAMHDCYIFYLSHRLGYDVDLQRWSLPWLSPGIQSLQRFGAFIPYLALESGQWWRMVTSTFMSSSIVQWILVLWSWRVLQSGGATPTRKWCYVYLAAVITGQIWMMAFDLYGIAGAATWGTSGVICAAGGARPRQRFLLFMTAIVMIILSLVEPHNSVVGTIGGSFFGWTFYGLGWSRVVSKFDTDAVKPQGLLRLLSGLALLKLWIVPLLFVAFRTNVDQTMLKKYK